MKPLREIIIATLMERGESLLDDEGVDSQAATQIADEIMGKIDALVLDAHGLHLLASIANLRAYLSGQASVSAELSLPRLLERKKQVEESIETLIARWLNHGLRAAGLPHAIDPATRPLPICEQRHPRQFTGPVANHY